MSLDIVLPAHNEEDRLGRTLLRYRRSLDGPDVGFLVALDGCVDGTADVVARHAALDPRVRGVRLPHLGKGGALAEALRRSTADVVAFVDADGATPPGELARLVSAVHDGADVAVASRRLPASVVPAPRSLLRRATSAGFATAVRAMFDLPHADTQCGAKAVSGPAARRLLPLLSSRDFLFDVDLLVCARSLGLRVDELPSVWIDKDGSTVDPVRDSARMAASALRLWLHHRVLPVARTEHEPAAIEDVVIDLTEDAEIVPLRPRALHSAGASRRAEPVAP